MSTVVISTQEPSLATALQEMEENCLRILEEQCPTISRDPVERRVVIRNTETIRNPDPAPITCVVRERCPTPDQIVDATVSVF